MPMLKVFSLVFILISLGFFCNRSALSQEQLPEEKYFKAQIVAILETDKVQVKILEGEEKDNLIELEYGPGLNLKNSQKLKKDETVVLLQQQVGENKTQYFIIDKYRLGNLAFIFFIFFFGVILVAGLQGLTSILGMLVSLLVILKFIVPQILQGHNPFLISLIGSLFILASTIYLAHGLNIKTHLAALSTLITLILTAILSVVFTQMALLTGLGSEEAYSLTLGSTAQINFKGLLLGGILIGALGSLDDVTTSQAAALFELNSLDAKISLEELIKRGMRIGKEHVAGMVNTLILAYAGASLALFLLFYLGAQSKPFWMILNSEVIAEEIIRALAGSTGLVLAVPITTFLAAYYLKKKKRH